VRTVLNLTIVILNHEVATGLQKSLNHAAVDGSDKDDDNFQKTLFT
jgi:hypothetical protein